MKYLMVYLLLINASGLLVMLADKRKAKKNAWRIPESTLMGVAAAGGSMGVLAGMYLFHHKTLHSKFSIGVPALLALHIALLCFLAGKFL